MEGKYNPGGVLPEVSSRSWLLFGGILAALLLLLVVPALFTRGVQAFASARASKPKARADSKQDQVGQTAANKYETTGQVQITN